MLGNAVAAMRQQRAFLDFGQAALPMRVAVAMTDQFVATRQEGVDQVGAMVIQRGVDQHARGQAQFVKQFQAAPCAHAGAVFAPGVVQHVRMRRGRSQFRPQPFAKREMLDVEAQVHGQPRAVRPGVVLPPGNRLIGEAAVASQGLGGPGSGVVTPRISACKQGWVHFGANPDA
ncbi:hypothetical protein D3C73_1073520 [compost metagenome]